MRYLRLWFDTLLWRQARRLRKLDPNWDGFQSPVIAERAIQAALRTLRSRPHLTPRSDGGVQIDWPGGAEIGFDANGDQDFE